MFGETEYDPSLEYASVPIEEQLEALGKGIDSGKVLCGGAVCITFFLFIPKCYLCFLAAHGLMVLDQVHWP
jgi:hypothetical protein